MVVPMRVREAKSPKSCSSEEEVKIRAAKAAMVVKLPRVRG